MSNNFQQDQVAQSWFNFVKKGQIEPGIEGTIKDSWIRCRNAGISPYVNVVHRVTDGELSARLQRNTMMTNIAMPLIQQFYDILQGEGFVITLSDPQGILLEVIGDQEAIEASGGNIVAGADWSERAAGANSTGTTLFLNAPTRYMGYEHFCRLPHRWVGSGAPIHDPEGRVIGCLSIAGEIGKTNNSLLCTTEFAAKVIDMRIRLDETLRYAENLRTKQQDLVNLMDEGILILDPMQKIVMSNQFMSNQFKLRDNSLLDFRIEELIDDRFLLHSIRQHEEISEHKTRFFFSGKRYDCNVSSKVMRDTSANQETILFIRDVKRSGKGSKKMQLNQDLMSFQDVIGESRGLKEMVTVAKAAASTDANVLILGESGTGKEIFAQAIHSSSKRANGPFVAINCAAIPNDLLASTLFGYEEGAFTGAKQGGAMGKFEQANHGTLFLDEIGELTPEAQAVLLRALETRRFSRVGGKESIAVDVRVIAATNCDLRSCSGNRRFRQDLYYRLSVFTLQLPPLRERLEDIPALSMHFLTRMNRRYDKKITGFNGKVMSLMTQYSWPGNVRELRNFVERMSVLTEGTEISFETAMLYSDFMVTKGEQKLALPEKGECAGRGRTEQPAAFSLLTGNFADGSNDEEALSPREKEEKAQLLETLIMYRWNITRASKELGVSRSTIYKKMDRFRIRY